MLRAPQPPRYARVTDDCFAALIRQFVSMANPKWAKYSASTRATWGRELQFMSRPDCLGALSTRDIRPALVQAYFDGIADRPGKSKAGYAALQQLEVWAIVRDLLPRRITTGVEISTSDAGHVPWTGEQIALAEAKARPDLARAV